jgi:hypothetical protein
LIPASAMSAAADSDDQKIVCKSERMVGSNMSQRICKTREKWAEDRQKGRDGARDVQGREAGIKPDGWYLSGSIPSVQSRIDPARGPDN